MSFKITATKTWREREVGKKLFVQNFFIDDMSGFKVGIKFSAVLQFSAFKQEYLCLLKVVEGKKILMGNVRVQIDYLHSDEKQKFCCFGMNGGSVKNGLVSFSFPRYLSDIHRFLEWKRERNSEPITWSITFDLNLEKSNEEPLAAENKLANKLFLKSELSDVKIFCEDKIFDCHKTILCCQSEVFKGMLMNEKMVEAITGEIRIKDISAKTMKYLLYFIYYDDLDETKSDSNLLLAADKYDLPDLVRFCVNHLRKNLTQENAMDVMKSSYLTDQKGLFRLACNFVMSNEKIVKTQAFEDMKKNNPILALEMLTEAMIPSQD